MTADFVAALSRALVIGLFGGAALILAQLYSRRGSIIYPVYAALLLVLGIFLGRAPRLTFGGRLAITFGAVVLSTILSLAAVVVRGARQREQLLASGRQVAPGRAPVWGMPLVLVVLFAVSAGVAFVSS